MSKNLIVKSQVTGLILSGGAGRRVSNKDKGLLKYRGKLLIESQIAWLQPQVRDILISANRNISTYENFGFPVIQDDIDDFQGPLQGVCEGLKRADGDWLFVQPVDMPSLPANLLQLLLEKINTLPLVERSECYYCMTHQRGHYLSLLIAKSKTKELSRFLDGDSGRVRDFHALIKSVPLDLGINEISYENLNRPEDYG